MTTTSTYLTLNYRDVRIGAMASQITGASIVYSTVCPNVDQGNIKALRPWPLWRNSPVTREGPVTGKRFPFDDVIMGAFCYCYHHHRCSFHNLGIVIFIVKVIVKVTVPKLFCYFYCCCYDNYYQIIYRRYRELHVQFVKGTQTISASISTFWLSLLFEHLIPWLNTVVQWWQNNIVKYFWYCNYRPLQITKTWYITANV